VRLFTAQTVCVVSLTQASLLESNENLDQGSEQSGPFSYYDEKNVVKYVV
jgi:hypothetical protein